MSATKRNVVDFSSIAGKYIDDALRGIAGMKALLIDQETTKIMSATYNHSQLLNHQVVLVETLGHVRERSNMTFLVAVVIMRPSSESQKLLCEEVAKGHFSEYHVIYTNIVEAEQLSSLGATDKLCAVKTVQEVFLDVVPVTDRCCVVPLQAPPTAILTLSDLTQEHEWNPALAEEWTPTDFARTVQGLAAMMLMAKRRPAIRYRAGSKAAERLGQELAGKMRTLRTTFPDILEKEAVLVILDRRDDPITPLLTPWTYEAMIHEFFGIHDGKVTLETEQQAIESAKQTAKEKSAITGKEEKPQVKPLEERVLVLSKTFDAFYAEHRWKNFGEACSGIQKVVETYKDAAKATDLKTATLEDLKKFVRDGTKVRMQSAIATRHTDLLGRLDDVVRTRKLLNLSLVEQDFAIKDNHQQHVIQMRERLASTDFDPQDLLRLVILYALRYQNQPDSALVEFKRALEAKAKLSKAKIALIDKALQYSGAKQRAGDCFHPAGPAGVVSASMAFVKRMAGFDSADNGAQSVYTQHEPFLKNILGSLWFDALSADQYPYIRASAPLAAASPTAPATAGAEAIDMYHPAYIFVFVIGGLTYEEALLVERVNNGEVTAKPSGLGSPMSIADRFRGSESREEKIDAKVFVASPSMINSADFLDALDRVSPGA